MGKPELIHENSQRIWLCQLDCAEFGRHQPPERRGGHLSVVCRLLWPYGRTELRFHQLAAVLGHTKGQRRLVQSERLVPALSAARELRAAVPPLMSHAADHEIIAVDHLGTAFEAEDLHDV